MANVSMGFFVLAVLVAGLLLHANPVLGADDCSGAFTKLLTCKEFVAIPGPPEVPSPGCCGVVQEIDISCVCANFPPELEKQVSMEKAVMVARECGKPLPHGSKCGSFTVPLA